jgi:hypothetical protein
MRPYLIVLLVLGLSVSLSAQEPGEFVVIANPGRSEVSLSHDEVSRIFLRKEPSWPRGGDARPVDQNADLPIRDHFSRVMHERRVQSVLLYWQQQVFSGRGFPPPVMQSDAEVIDYVARTPGAIGYVSSGIRLAGVKSLRVVD